LTHARICVHLVVTAWLRRLANYLARLLANVLVVCQSSPRQRAMKQPLLKAWFVALLAVATHISFSTPDSSSFSSSPLHSEYSLACSACELIVRDVARELSRLSPDVRSSRVVDIDANGGEREAFYEVRLCPATGDSCDSHARHL
jgi:adenosine deaminase